MPITACHPNIIARQETRTLRIYGDGTDFWQDSVVTVSGAGVTEHHPVEYHTSEWIDIDITVDASAATGLRDVNVTTPSTGDNVTLVGAITLCKGTTPRVIGIGKSPGDVRDFIQVIQGESLSVYITGAHTWFYGKEAVFYTSGGVPDAEITVHSTSVGSPTEATAYVTVDKNATLGWRDVNMV